MSIKHTIVVYTFLWIGFVMGISFLETPLKFQLPNITLALEMGIASLVFTLVLLILLIQPFWLLPVLDTRPERFVQGAPLPDSFLHFLLCRSRSRQNHLPDGFWRQAIPQTRF